MKNQSLKGGADNSAQTSEALDARDFSINENADYGAQNVDATKNLDENAQDFSVNLASETSGRNPAPCEQNSKDFSSVECCKNQKNLRKRKIIRTSGILRRRKTYQVHEISLASKISPIHKIFLIQVISQARKILPVQQAARRFVILASRCFAAAANAKSLSKILNLAV